MPSPNPTIPACVHPSAAERASTLTPPQGDIASPLETGRSMDFEAEMENIRRHLASGDNSLFSHAEDRFRRRLGLAPMCIPASLVVLLFAVGVRLALALFATGVTGEWIEIPWGRWAIVLVFFGVVDVASSFMNRPLDMPSSPVAGRFTREWTALLPTLSSDSDLCELASFNQRWNRLATVSGVGAAVASMMLLANRLVDTSAMNGLPIGSVVLLALLLFDFGEGIVHQDVFRTAFLRREARYDHDLFWLSPVDTPEVAVALRMGAGFGLITGVWISLYFAMAVVLVGWASTVVVPLAIGFVLIGYAVTICATLGDRSSINRIVETSRARSLAELQDRIATLGPTGADVVPEEAVRLEGLIHLHDRVRDAPKAPTRIRSVGHAAAGLIVPTITFFVTVFGEVYTERLLDTILP